ncbi:MAG TPA: mechanosensitive ion channel domain-containing protein [Candidatus Acidoferrum sp.]
MAVAVTSCTLGFTHDLAAKHLRTSEVRLQQLKAIPSDSQDSGHAPQDSDKALTPIPGDVSAQAIPLPQIADRAQELNHMLREITSQLTPKTELLYANEEVEAQTAKIRERSLESRDLLADNPTPMELEDEHRYWRSRSQEYRTRRKLLAALATKLQEQIQLLDAQLPAWEGTWDRTHELSGIDAVLAQVRKALEAIRATRSQVDEQLKLVLTVQNHVSQQDQQVSDVLVSVRQLREQELSHLLEPDSVPLWEARKRPPLNQTAATVFRRSLHRSFSAAEGFLLTNRVRAFGLVALYLLVLFGVWKLRRHADDGTRLDVPARALLAMQKPFSLALLLALLLTVQYAESFPIAVTFVFHLLCVIPVLRLLLPMIERELRGPLYIATISYAVMGTYLLVQLPPPIKRELHVLIVFASLVSFSWILRLLRKRQSPRGRTALILRISARVCLLLLGASFVANIVGYVSLSQLLSLPSLIGPFIAAALCCAARVLAPLLGIVLRMPWLRNVPEVPVDAMEHWVDRLLSLGVLLLWATAMLHLLTVYDYVTNVSSMFLRHPIGFEKVNFTLAGVFMVVVIVLVGYILSNALTFFLQNFVLVRWRLKRGLPYAISKVTYYFCLVLVGLAALSAAGVELNKFTVLTGAIGVGLGFGMQNIVNNFVSGLILIFERPIHVGDIVDVGGLEGTVRRIGARSSTVLTFQGAEVIVPNSNLLSNQLINWTLSSQWRRLDIPVGVAYGTDPEQVIKLLVGVAESHPGVLLQRPPAAFFRGFGESALNFELRFWSAQQDTWLHLLSDVTVAVAKALRVAGIEIPFPQRDLHVRSVDVFAATTLSHGLQDTPAQDHSVRT